MAPRCVGPWEILSVIGRGGTGIVYRARHRESGLPAAVKLLGPAPLVEPRAARRLAREFAVLRRLDHPNVVRVFGTGVHDGFTFLAMELVEGLDLRAFLSPGVAGWDHPPGAGAGPFQGDGAGPPEADGAAWALAGFLTEPETAPPAGFPVPFAAARDPAVGPARRALSPALAAALAAPGRLARLRDALRQILEALAYLHRRWIVHRDLKPSNIMVDDRRRARIMDFGLVKHAEEGGEPVTGAGRAVGTYRYMSPEQAQGLPVDGRSDLYSLGVLLYELLAAAPPFVSSDPAVLWDEILHAPPPSLAAVNPGVPPSLAAIAERCLRKDPAARFESAEEILAALERLG